MTRNLLAAALLAPSWALAAPDVTYTLDYHAPDARLAVSICTDSARAERRFLAYHERAADFIGAITRDSGGAIEHRGDAIVAPHWRAGECLHYQVDLDAITRARQSGLGWRVGDDRLFSPHAVLWRPHDLARAEDAEIRFVLPEGYSVSVPWQSTDAAPPRRNFKVGTTPVGWPTLIAIGRFAELDMPAGEGSVRVAIAGVTEPARRAVLENYVRTAATDVAALFPSAFARHPQIVTIPIGPQSEAVPFGQSFRGGGTGILLFIDPTRSAEDYLQAWTLHHELIHVIHPYLDLDGRWIAEGIATYFQNVVRSRRLRQSAREGWEELDAGFARGRADTASLSLKETSIEMSERGHYMRAYWSGTALMLLADVELHARAKPASVELALNRYLKCCALQPRRWEVREFLAELDRQVGGDTFTRLYREHADATYFPDVAPAYTTLGIDADSEGPKLSDDHLARMAREAIMGAE